MVGSDIDIDDILRPRREREAMAVAEKTERQIARDKARTDQDSAVGAAIGKIWRPE